jgi:hypothetical protein
MGMTSYDNGFREGAMIRGAALYDGGYGRVWYVDAKVGGDGNTGRRRDRPLLTMSKAFTLVDSGDTIVFRGKVREELTTPAGVFDVTVIGAANRPRHADDHSEDSSPGRGSSSATWAPPASPTTATSLCIVQQQGWRFQNILFDCPVDAAALRLNRDAASGDSERDASHTSVYGCRFTSGLIGIQNAGGASFCHVAGNVFHLLTESGGAGVKCTSTSVAVPLTWLIEDNHFHNNASHILSSMSYSTIRNNIFGRFTATLSIDIDDQPSANQGEYNVITNNYLSGTYGATAYPPGSNNEWAGNYNSLTGGVTADDPA